MLDDEYYKPAEFDSIREMEEAGVLFFYDHSNSIMHNKFLIVDHRWVWTGSANFSFYDSDSNANVIFLFDSQNMAQVFSERFERLWGNMESSQSDSHRQQSPDPKTVTVAGTPYDVYFMPSWSGVNRLKEMIAAAEHSIHFEIFAFTLDELSSAIDSRCGEVEIIGIYDAGQAGQSSSVVNDIKCPSAIILPSNLTGSAGYNKLHHKLLIIDGEGANPWVATGSMNWSKAGATENDETLLVFPAPNTASLFEAEFATRLNEAD
jgi:phosphatidylserine/phosphatidylglycerophosphate/cardiolipin synthase-like enzyme